MADFHNLSWPGEGVGCPVVTSHTMAVPFAGHSSPVPICVTSLKAAVWSQCSNVYSPVWSSASLLELTGMGRLLEAADMSPRCSWNLLPKSYPQESTARTKRVDILAWNDPSRMYCWLLCGLILHMADCPCHPPKKSTYTRQRTAGLKPKGILALIFYKKIVWVGFFPEVVKCMIL